MADPGTLAVKAALTAVQVGLSMLNKTEGPRLDDLNVTLADYGTPITYFWGKKRLEGRPIIWAEKLREKKKTSKGKGGKYADYQYFGTWACLIAGHAIDSVSRIWLDRHLVYDATREGPMTPILGMFQGLGSSPVKLLRGRNMRIYDGTQTAPDRRIEEWCEDRYGADTCPAYKGMAYIVFEELPLEKFGNRIPQVTIEAVNNKTDQYLLDTLDVGGLPQFSPDGLRFDLQGYIWDTATLTRILNGPDIHGWAEDGTIWNLSGNYPVGPTLTAYGADGQFSRDGVVCPIGADDVILIDSLVFLRPYGAVQPKLILLAGNAFTIFDIDFSPSMGLRAPDGTAYVLGGGGSDGIHVLDVTQYREGAASQVIPTSSTSTVAGWENDDGYWVLLQESTVYIVDPADGFAILNSSTDYPVGVTNVTPGSYSFWTVSGSTAQEISSLDLSLIRTVDLTAWGGSGTGGVYDPVNHAIFQSTAGNTRVLYLDRIGSEGTDLADVVDDVAEWCGFDPSDVDTSDLDQVVQGYSVTQGAGKDMLQPLFDIHDVDARPHDFGAEFIKRGRAANGTVLTKDFVRDGDEPRYVVTLKQDTDLPRRISLNFADQDKDQQTNTVISQRPLDGTDATREQTIDLNTYVATPSDAQKFTDRYFRRLWNEREGINLSLTAQHLAAEPGDTYDLSLDGSTRYARIKKWTLTSGKVQLELVRDALSFATLNSGSGSDMDGRDDEEVYIPAPAKGIILDIPLVRDSHNHTNPLLYYAAGGYSNSNFPGAVIYERDGNEDEFFEWNAVDSADKAVWGYATETLQDANCDIWDRASSVNIGVRGTLTSCTEADIDANPLTNLAYLGGENGDGELLNFTTATLESDGTYTLSGFKRGRRGTEGYSDAHATGDTFVLVSSLEVDGRGLDDIGTELGFKTQTLGRDVDSAYLDTLDYAGATLKPYAPAHFTATKDPSTGDWNFTWVRRTRVGGNWVGGASIPLGETSENYKVRIYDPDDPDGDPVRTITSTSESASWTAAQQTADFGGAQLEVLAGVCQVADAVDGFEARIERGAAPSVVGVGSFAEISEDGTPAPSLPTGLRQGDLMLLACETSETDTIAAPAGWVSAPDSPKTASNSKLHLFWRRYEFGDTAPLVSKTGDHLVGQMVAVRGGLPRGNPFDAYSSGATNGTSLSLTGLTTAVPNCLIVDFVSTGWDPGALASAFTGWANADLADLAERFDGVSDIAFGGGVACNTGVKATAGSVSATSVTSASADGSAFIKLAIRPE